MNRYFIRYPGYRTKALTLSYDDGVVQDARLMEIMDRFGIRGTFNLNGGYFSGEAPRSAPPHLSREQAEAWLAANAKEGWSKVLFLHQHRE